MLSLHLLDLNRLDVGGTTAASKHDLRGLELRQKHIALNLPVVFFVHRYLHHHPIVAVINQGYLEVNKVVPYVLRVAGSLELVLHHVVVESWDLLVRKEVEV